MIQTYRLTYDLPSGYLHDWLVLGPILAPANLDQCQASALETRWANLAAGRPAAPLVEHAPHLLEKTGSGEREQFWKLEHAQPDHRLERLVAPAGPVHAQLWAACLLTTHTAQKVTLLVRSACPAAAWLNGQLCTPGALRFANGQACFDLNLALQAGENRLLLLLEDVGGGPQLPAVLLSAQVKIEPAAGLAAGITVLSPEVEYWKKTEHNYARMRLERAVYSGGQRITLLGPVEDGRPVRANVRLQKTSGEIYGEYLLPLFSAEAFPLSTASELPSGDYQVLLMPPPELYYDAQFRPTHAIPFRVVNEQPLDQPEIPVEERKATILRAAEKRGGLFGLAASLAAGRAGWTGAGVLDSVLQRAARAELNPVELLGLWLVKSLAGQRTDPAVLTADQLAAIEQAFTSYPYACLPQSDDSAILLLDTCQVLGGQAYPHARFAAVGLPGGEVRAAAETRTAAWLSERALGGFPAGRPDPDRLALALVLLVDYADNDALRELAAVCLDQLLFGLAARAFHGLPDPAGASLPAGAYKTNRALPGSALSLLLWGQGMPQPDLSAAVCLAASESYELPEIIAAIAWDQPEAAWTVENAQQPDHQPAAGQYAIYKTPTYRLSSFNGGEDGNRCDLQLSWQAALSPDALVFSSDPGSYSQAAQRPAGFWRGSDRRPTTRQWKDALICRYSAAQPAALGFTHAYFPVEAFEETRIGDGWAFARLGETYLALYAEQGLTLVLEGEDAGRELRSPGSLWACQMGHSSQDGRFDDFCRRCQAAPPDVTEQQVAWNTIRGDRLLVEADGTLRVNGEDPAGGVALSSPYAILDRPAKTMTIHHQAMGLELTF